MPCVLGRIAALRRTEEKSRFGASLRHKAIYSRKGPTCCKSIASSVSMGLFVFLLGAVSSLVVAFILLVNFINKVEEKTQKEYDDIKKALEEPELQVFLPSLLFTLFHTNNWGESEMIQKFFSQHGINYITEGAIER